MTSEALSALLGRPVPAAKPPDTPLRAAIEGINRGLARKPPRGPLAELEIELLGEKLYTLSRDQAAWSQATFGKDADRGPVGALKHLAEEAGEVVAEWERRYYVPGVDAADEFHDDNAAALFRADWRNGVRLELADCLILLLDGARRAGFMPIELLDAALEKLAINKAREWPASVDGEPCKHLKGAK